jgi:voltage-gated potassium channel
VESFRMERLQARLRDHTVICGFGAEGQVAARAILARGAPPTPIVVFDHNERPREDAADLGLTGLRGDAARTDVLADAAVDRARGVIVCAGNDAANALISLAVRKLSRTTRLVVAADGLDARPIMQQSGADAVVSASALGGYVLADALESPRIADLLVDILSARGDAEWREVDITEDHVGAEPHVKNCVVIAVRRGSSLLWPWQAAAQRLLRGDRLIVVRAPGSSTT